ncbi:alternate-type signal peptide domain-containing protein [Nocardiaceae bacterium NPDC056970]
MNKKTKGAIAAGAAAALLAGGAGSFALWSADAELGGGTINSGTMTLTTKGTPSWTVNGQAVGNWSAFKAVPGDVLTYNAEVTIGATGNNLKADLTVDDAAFSGDEALIDALGTPDVSAKLGGVDVPEITSAHNGQDIDVAVSFTFDKPVGVDNTTQTKAATLDAMTLTLKQK